MRRGDLIGRLSDHPDQWDLLVIGGGATGLSVALDAASRGLDTILFEGADFAGGTSSQSTKLIHGGVRYLRGGEVSLVRESLEERGHLLRNAPGLVEPLSFAVPAFRWFDRGYYGAGLVLYDLLAGKLGIGSTRDLSREKISRLVPNLRQEGLRGGTQYWDGQFDDARLAVALARTAVREGAVVLNHCRVTDLIKGEGKIAGAVVEDRIGGDEYEVGARAVINATGVWSDSIRKMDDPEAPTVMEPSQGIHIVVDSAFLGGETAIMLPETSDGRVLFAIPWKNRVVIGTTDTPGVGVSHQPKPQDEEIEYLLRHSADFLERTPGQGDIRATFAGLRPLVKPEREGGSTASISRKHSLFFSRDGLITMTGGKWTTCRSMGEAAVDAAVKYHSLVSAPCRTRDLSLDDGGNPQDRWDEPEMGERLDDALPYRMSDVAMAVHEEMAESLEDVLSRRTRCRILDEAGTWRCAEKVARFMAREKGKDEQWVQVELKNLRENLTCS